MYKSITESRPWNAAPYTFANYSLSFSSGVSPTDLGRRNLSLIRSRMKCDSWTALSGFALGRQFLQQIVPRCLGRAVPGHLSDEVEGSGLSFRAIRTLRASGESRMFVRRALQWVGGRENEDHSRGCCNRESESSIYGVEEISLSTILVVGLLAAMS